MAHRETYETWGGRPVVIARMVVGAAFFAFTWPSESLLFSAFWLLTMLYGLWMALFGFAYKGTLSPDGELWFKSLLREWRCPVEEVRKISASRGEGARRFTIRMAAGSVRISQWRGDPIVYAIRLANPEVKEGGFGLFPD